MKARQMIEGAAFGPEALRVMGQALDEAWDEVAGSFDNEIARHAARLVLAGAILAKATNASRDVEELKYAGRRALVLKYPWLIAPTDTAKWV